MGSWGDGVAGGGRGPGHTWPKSHRWGWRWTGDSSLDSCKKSWWGRWGMGTSRWEGVWGTHDLGSKLRAQPRGGVVGGWPAAQRRLKFPFKSRAQVSPQDPSPQALTPWGCVSRALLLLWNLPCFPGLLAFPPQGEYGIEDLLIPREGEGHPVSESIGSVHIREESSPPKKFMAHSVTWKWGRGSNKHRAEPRCWKQVSTGPSPQDRAVSPLHSLPCPARFCGYHPAPRLSGT